MGKYWYTDSNGKRKRTAAGYKREYKLYGGTAKAKAERAARNNARRSALRSGRAHKWDGTAVDHKDSNPLNNSPSNLRLMSAKKNSARKENSRKKGSRRRRYGDKRK